MVRINVNELALEKMLSFLNKMLSYLRHSTDVIEILIFAQQKYGKEKYLCPSRRADGSPTSYPEVSVKH